jgi:hypothetical protein
MINHHMGRTGLTPGNTRVSKKQRNIAPQDSVGGDVLVNPRLGQPGKIEDTALSLSCSCEMIASRVKNTMDSWQALAARDIKNPVNGSQGS